MKDLDVAQKYARALFAEAQEKNELRACQQGLEEFVRAAGARKSLAQILAHPFIALEEKKRIIHSALGEYAMPLLEKFMTLLVVKTRLELLFAIAEAFQTEVDRFQNVQALRIRSAFPLREAGQKELQKTLETWLKSRVRMEVKVDPQLIGGIVIQTPDYVLDQSLKGQLERLQRALAS